MGWDNIGDLEKDTSSFTIGRASPILVFGVIVFILPYIDTIIGWNLPGWISGIGIFIIILGSLLSLGSVIRGRGDRY